jgi:hypothetical protein
MEALLQLLLLLGMWPTLPLTAVSEDKHNSYKLKYSLHIDQTKLILMFVTE